MSSGRLLRLANLGLISGANRTCSEYAATSLSDPQRSSASKVLCIARYLFDHLDCDGRQRRLHLDA
jgi:hypothetical protein